MLRSFRNYHIVLSKETVSCMDLEAKSPWPKLPLPALNAFTSVNKFTVDGLIPSLYYPQFFLKTPNLSPNFLIP